MKIAICGKGGVGKTTISGILCRVLGKKGIEVLAIDGDPNPNLSHVLGLSSGPPPSLPLSSKVLEKGEDENGNRYIRLGIPLSELISDYGIKAKDKITLLAVGAPEHASSGCMCSSHTTVREIINAALASKETVTVLDMEASMEHMKRGTSRYVDIMLMVVEPYFRSMEAAGRFAKLAKEMGIKTVAAIANKVRNPEELKAIHQYCAHINLPVMAVIPFDPNITVADSTGASIVDRVPDSEAVLQIQSLADQLIMETAG